MCHDDALYKFTFYLLTYLLTLDNKLTYRQLCRTPQTEIPESVSPASAAVRGRRISTSAGPRFCWPAAVTDAAPPPADGRPESVDWRPSADPTPFQLLAAAVWPGLHDISRVKIAISASSHSGLAVARLTAVCEVLGSNCIVDSYVYHQNHCDLQPWTWAVHTLPAVPRSTQPSTVRLMVDEYQLSG